MKRVTNLPRMDDRGESGISPMLLVITSLLVTGSAGALLITLNSDLASQAFHTNRDVQKYVSSKYQIMAVILVDVTLNQDIEELYLTTKLGSGSKPLTLKNTGITLSNPNFRAELTYSSNLNEDDDTHFTCEMPTTDEAGSGKSGMITDPSGDFSLEDPNLQKDTIVQIHIDLDAAIGASASPGDKIHVRIVTDRCSPAYVTFQVPEVIETKITHLK